MMAHCGSWLTHYCQDLKCREYCYIMSTGTLEKESSFGGLKKKSLVKGDIVFPLMK